MLQICAGEENSPQPEIAAVFYCQCEEGEHL